MMFLNLENQLFLILELVFSSYLLINTFNLRPHQIRLRAFGLNFSIPFFLSIAAFLTASYNKASALALLLVAHVLLIFLCTISLFLKQKSESSKLFYFLPFFLVVVSLFCVRSTLDPNWLRVFYLVDLGLILFNLALTVHSLFHKQKEHLLAYLSLFIMASSLGIWLLAGAITMESVLLMAISYGTCSVYSYHNTWRLFFKEYKKSTESLHKMNTSMQLEVIRRVEEIERSNKKLLEISKTDSMTGLYVKSVVLKNLATLLERSPQTTLSLLMVDIDNFKEINDTSGHQVGDRCIRSLATLCKTSFRKDDILGRYGGDEFMALLPATPPVKAYLIADRFRQVIQSKSSPKITISIGIANYPEDAKTPALLIDAADKALYASKQKGRNLVTFYSSLKEVK